MLRVQLSLNLNLLLDPIRSLPSFSSSSGSQPSSDSQELRQLSRSLSVPPPASTPLSPGPLGSIFNLYRPSTATYNPHAAYSKQPPQSQSPGTPTSQRKYASADLLDFMKFCLDAHNNYSGVRSFEPEGPIFVSYLRDIRLICRDKYKECLKMYIKATFQSKHASSSATPCSQHNAFANGVNKFSASDFLSILSRHQVEDIRGMCQDDEWSRLRVDALAVIVENVWCGREESGIFTKAVNKPVYVPQSSDPQKVCFAATTTVNLIRSIIAGDVTADSTTTLSDNIVRLMLIPLIRNLPSDTASVLMAPEKKASSKKIADKDDMEDGSDEKKTYEESSTGSYHIYLLLIVYSCFNE